MAFADQNQSFNITVSSSNNILSQAHDSFKLGKNIQSNNTKDAKYPTEICSSSSIEKENENYNSFSSSSSSSSSSCSSNNDKDLNNNNDITSGLNLKEDSHRASLNTKNLGFFIFIGSLNLMFLFY